MNTRSSYRGLKINFVTNIHSIYLSYREAGVFQLLFAQNILQEGTNTFSLALMGVGYRVLGRQTRLESWARQSTDVNSIAVPLIASWIDKKVES